MSSRAIDPLEKIEEINASQIADKVRWVALTHIDSKEYHRKLKEAGFAKVLVKPFRFGDFLHSVSNDFDQQVETREDLPALDAANAAAMQLSAKNSAVGGRQPGIERACHSSAQTFGC